MLTNGSTAIDLAVLASGELTTVGGSPGGAVATDEGSAWANSSALPNRSAGALARAFMSARSRVSGTSGRVLHTEGDGSANCFIMIACGLGPVNGGRPASISYSTHARLYWSERPSISASPLACSGLM